MKELKEFLQELKDNQKINNERGLENRIDIEYVIKRIERIIHDDMMERYNKLEYELNNIKEYIKNNH